MGVADCVLFLRCENNNQDNLNFLWMIQVKIASWKLMDLFLHKLCAGVDRKGYRNQMFLSETSEGMFGQKDNLKLATPMGNQSQDWAVPSWMGQPRPQAGHPILGGRQQEASQSFYTGTCSFRLRQCKLKPNQIYFTLLSISFHWWPWWERSKSKFTHSSNSIVYAQRQTQ